MLKPVAIFLVLVLLLTLGTACTCSKASDQYCTITGISGTVTVLLEDSIAWTEAEINTQLRAGDRIRTTDNSSAIITFFEGSVIELESNTEVGITELIIEVGPKSTTISLEQVIGTTINRVQKLVDTASSYEIETPSAVAAVRGTEYEVVVRSDSTTTVIVTEGNVSVTAQGVSVLVSDNEQTTVLPGEPPGIPVPATVRGGK
jgi:ferric-dicitrate binding protein FerR (iron transport regulator)